MKKVETVVTVKQHFEKRGEAFFNKFWENLDYQHFDARINIIGFQINLCSMRVGFSIENLLEEIKPEVNEENVVEFLQNSKILDCWECSDFDAKNQMTEN